jgi:hypothetical protein
MGMFPCERVELSCTENAPYRLRNAVELAITPEQLFEVPADAESWASVITKPAAPYRRPLRHCATALG